MAYTQEQYQAAGEWLAANLDNPGLVASTIQQLGLSQSDVLAAARTVDPSLTAADVTGYFNTQNIPIPAVWAGPGALSLAAGDTTAANTFVGPTVVGGGGNDIIRLTGGDSTLTNTGTLTGTGALTAANTFVGPTVVGGGGNDAIQLTGGNSTLTGTGTLTGGNTFVGPTVTGGGGNDIINLTTGTTTGNVSTTTNATDAPQMVDYTGKAYDVAEVTSLANELKLATDANMLGGGVFGEKRASVGFNYDELSRVLGRAPSTYEQVLFDAARQMIDQGITSLSDLDITEQRGDVTVRNEINEMTGQETGNKIATYVDFRTGQLVSRVLTPEEVAQIRTEEVTGYVDEGSHTYTRSYLDDFAVTGRTLVGPDGRIISSQELVTDEGGNTRVSGPLSLFAGETYTGKGSTDYYITYDEQGRPKFGTSADSDNFNDLVNGLLFVGQFIPGMQPFVMAANAVRAAEQGNVIGALASLAGAGAQFTGSELLSNVSSGLRIAQAVETGDIGTIVTALANNPTINSMAGSTMITDTISLADVGRGVQLATGLQNGDYGSILTAAGGLLNNNDFKIAGAAANIVREISKDNPDFGNIIQSVGMITNLTNGAANKVDAGTATRIAASVANNTANDITTAANTTDLATATYVGLMNAGATSDEAYELSKVIAATPGGTTNTTNGVIQVQGGPGVDTVETTAVAGPGTITTTDLGTLGTTTTTRAVGADTTGGGAAVDTVAGGAGADTTDRTIRARTFGEAFRTARDRFGPGQTFTWNGKEYSTATFSERPDLSGTNVVPGSTSTTAGGGRGSYAGFDAAAAAAAFNTDQQLRAASATDAAQSTSLWQRGVDWLQNTMKMSSEAANDYLRNNPDSPFTQSVSTAMEAAGELQRNVGGGLATMLGNKPVADVLVKGGEDLIRTGQALGTGPQDTRNWQTTQSLIESADGLWEKLGVVAGRIIDGNSGLGRQVEMELRQELPALFLGGGTAKGILVASGLIDTADTAGNAAVDAYDSAVKAGKSQADALSDARRAGAAAGAAEAVVQLTVGKLADLGLGKLDDIIRSGVGRDVARVTGRGTGETIGEGGEEAASTAAVDLALTGTTDLNKVLTAGVIGSAVGSGTSTSTSPVTVAEGSGATTTGTTAGTDAATLSGTGTTTGAGAVTGPAAVDTVGAAAVDTSNIILAGGNADAAVNNTITDAANSGGNVAAAVDGSVNAAVTSGADAGSVSTTAVNSAINGGMDGAAAVNVVTDSVITAGGNVNNTVNNAVNTAVLNGTDTTVAADAATNAANNTGANVTVNADTNANGSVATTTVTNADTNTNTTTTVDTNTNTNTTVTTNNNSNITVDTTVNNNINTSTVTVTDNNTNTSTTVNVNTDTDQIEVVDGGNLTTTVIDSTTIDLGDGRVIDTTTGEVLDPDEVERRRRKLPSLPRKRSPFAGAPAGRLPTYPYKPTDIEETWLGGRFLDIAPFAAIFGLLPEDTPLGQEAKIFSALQRASGAAGDEAKGPTGGFKGIDEREEDRTPGFYSYGKEPDAASVLAPFMDGGSVQTYNTGGKIMSSPLMAARGGDVPHKGSHYVQGAGGGQDDLIPARLADGEYVFDAEIVAALGDGSNKEGARRLDAMREAIRKHKRSGSLKKIPPPAKSPLQYLKEATK